MSKNQKDVIKLHGNQDPNAKIEAIKNLIFGENMEAYEAEFEALKEDILNKKKILEDLIEEVGSDLRKSLDDVSTDVNIRITDLEKSLETKLEDLEEKSIAKDTLGKLLIELGEKVSSK
ncbi:fructose 1,6-bisphosphatase [Maribacter polysaccharolyticus]|uniref:fructose 1,6-bisphosphatase n=1 Tax=Maribacter polysaccharolyticus TaxID=3020831 RepID=UPI00237FB5A2|nr:fructose 1,6-bisphosphatase [Maribacter polysaccharolyticus]MDE3742405.1 fructose 1,6-bisphosphatase [Maribacter polysaccharolyticus]